MEPRVHFITIATTDLDAVRRFYVDGLGWASLLDVPGEIIFFQTGPGLVLGFFDAEQFAADLGGAPAASGPPAGFTLSHNVPSPDDVDRALNAASAAGATIVKPGQWAAFGGYHGHFADPEGMVWEVAHNPDWQVTEDGTVLLGVVDDDD